MKKPLIMPDYVSEWSVNLLRKMLIPSENDRIGWDELIKYVLSADKSKRIFLFLGNGSSQNSEK